MLCCSLWWFEGHAARSIPQNPRGESGSGQEIQHDAGRLPALSWWRHGVSICLMFTHFEWILCFLFFCQNVEWMVMYLNMLLHRHGDYPMLPNRSQQERDPWYQWDHPDLRRNWGEPVYKNPYKSWFMLNASIQVLSLHTCCAHTFQHAHFFMPHFTTAYNV